MASSAEAMDVSESVTDSEKSSLATILSEFENRDDIAKQKISLREHVISPDGRIIIQFVIDDRQNFTLHCPSNYPDYNFSEDNFFVEADIGLQLWCNALNEYLLDTEGRLTLTSILGKGMSLYSSTDAAAVVHTSARDSPKACSSQATAGASSQLTRWRRPDKSDEFDDMEDEDDGHDDEEDEDDDETTHIVDDEQLEDILDNDLSWELEIARRKKRWRVREAQLRAERARASNNNAKGGSLPVNPVAGPAAMGPIRRNFTALESYYSDSANSEDSLGPIPAGVSAADEDKTLQQLYHDPTTKSRQPKQVFTSAAASGILTNDLVSIMETTYTTGIEADTVDDNIFQWNVKVRNFAANCSLDKDFQELKNKFGYDYIELLLDFSMDLYPFFPPLVKVIRPRLQGSMMLRVTSMEILKLSYWNPARDMKSVLVDIKAFLQTWARLDLNSERNDRARYPDGAYIDIEHHLLRLALVSEIVPRANKKYVTAAPPLISLPASAMESTTIATASTSTSSSTSKSSQLASMTALAHMSPLVQSMSESEKISVDELIKKKFATKSKLSTMFFSSGGFGSSSSMSPNVDLDKKKKLLTATKNMAKGIGYSSYQQKGWDVKAYMAAQKEKDKQIELVLAKILQELKKLNSGSGRNSAISDPCDGVASKLDGQSNGDLTVNDADPKLGPSSPGQTGSGSSSGSGDGGCRRNSSRRKRKHSPDEPFSSDSAVPIDPLSDLYAVLEGSALVPFLEARLRADSFLEICSHPNVYICVISIIKEIVSQPYLVSLLGPLPDQIQSLQSLLASLEAQAKVLLDKIGKAAANGSVPKSGGKATAEKVTDKTSDDKLARDFLSLSQEVTQALKNTGHMTNGEASRAAWPSPKAIDCQSQSDKSSPSALPKDPSVCTASDEVANIDGSDVQAEPKKATREDKSADLYRKHMKGLQIDSISFSLTGNQAHYFSSHFQRAGSPNSTVIFRIAQELSSLTTSLPLDFSSSIFLRSDDDRSTLLRVIITGPEGTPYTGGCYQFDIYFPPKYPLSAPEVNFRTTGGGLVRFNPNLYNCGKVCLSLLGTWEGASGEQWNETSTLLQVLISIQSLILCAEPYFNEPGYDRNYGTPAGEADSLRYSEEVFKNNLKYAILGQLQNPPEGFEEVVRSHFFLKRHILLKELEQQMEKYKSKSIRKQFEDVKRELMKLEQPPGLKDSYKSSS